MDSTLSFYWFGHCQLPLIFTKLIDTLGDVRSRHKQCMWQIASCSAKNWQFERVFQNAWDQFTSKNIAEEPIQVIKWRKVTVCKLCSCREAVRVLQKLRTKRRAGNSLYIRVQMGNNLHRDKLPKKLAQRQTGELVWIAVNQNSESRCFLQVWSSCAIPHSQ